MMTTLAVSEIFGPTIQGEGPNAGQRAVFVRLGRCNLDCSWCDTPFTWDWKGKNGVVYDPAEQVKTMTVKEVGDEVADLAGDAWTLIVVSGGEPLLQAKALKELREETSSIGPMEVETNGTRPPVPDDVMLNYNVSPKLAHSGVSREKAIRPTVLREFLRYNTAFKFVVQTEADLDEVQAIVDNIGIQPDYVWIMPEGRDEETLERRLIDLAQLAIDRGWNVSGRLHVSIWGDQRGH